jgi:hypothetical protein
MDRAADELEAFPLSTTPSASPPRETVSQFTDFCTDNMI